VVGEPSDGESLYSNLAWTEAGVSGPGEGIRMAKDARREAGELNVRNSFVGESSTVLFAGVSAGTRLPLMFDSARGSIDLRRRWPPRGTIEMSTA